MSIDRDKLQIILLRTLGILLIAVGITMTARHVQSEEIHPMRFVQAISSGDAMQDAFREFHRPRMCTAHMRVVPEPPPVPQPPSIKTPPHAPASPKAPKAFSAPPAPPPPPAPSALSSFSL